jgi:hypothetical protein
MHVRPWVSTPIPAPPNALQRLTLRHNFRDEAQLEAFARGNTAAGQDHAHRFLAWDHARQSVHAAATGDQANTRLRQREQRILGGNDDIARQCRLEPAAHRPTIHGCDQRLVQIEAMRDAGEAIRTIGTAPSCRLHLQVVASRECALACAGDNPDPQVVARGELVPYGGEFVVRVGMQRVQNFRPVQRDGANVTFVLHDAVVCHPPITASFRSPPILPSSIPNQSASTSALCCPSNGADLIGAVLPENRTGQPLIV